MGERRKHIGKLTMRKSIMEEEWERKRIENDLRQLFEQSLPGRIRRYQEVKPHPIVANHHFSLVSAECIDLFQDGHFYGCISLAQAVAEALVKFLCNRNQWKPEKSFEKNLEKLVSRRFISEQTRDCLEQIWKKRDDYHHLNQSVQKDRQKLEAMAKAKMKLLNKVEGEIFAFTIVDGKICPSKPKYWDIDGNKADVFLRCR